MFFDAYAPVVWGQRARLGVCLGGRRGIAKHSGGDGSTGARSMPHSLPVGALPVGEAHITEQALSSMSLHSGGCGGSWPCPVCSRTFAHLHVAVDPQCCMGFRQC